MQKIKDFLVDRRIGFWLSCGAALLSIIVGIVYGACYSNSVYLNGWGVALPILGAVLFIAATAVEIFFDKIPYIGSLGVIAMFALDFIGFLVFINAAYMYLSTIFYGGFSAELLGDIDGAFIVCILFFIIAIVLSNVGIYLNGSKSAKIAANNEKKEIEA